MILDKVKYQILSILILEHLKDKKLINQEHEKVLCSNKVIWQNLRRALEQIGIFFLINIDVDYLLIDCFGINHNQEDLRL